MDSHTLVDARWDGNFGIGRFGREVRSRLAREDLPLYRSEDSALSVRGILGLRQELAKRRSRVFYSPAFTGTLPVKGVAQLLTVFDLIHLDQPGESSLKKRAYYRSVVAPAIKRAGWVATSSEYSRDRILSWLGREAVNVTVDVVGCGVSSDFCPDAEALIEKSTFTLVSNTGKHKNVETVLRSLKDIPAAKLTWVVNDQASAAELVRKHGVEQSVVLRSNLSDSDLAALYRSSSALLFPSKLEGFGLPPVEAMACNVPVIYSPQCLAAEETCGSVSGNVRVSTVDSRSDWSQAIESMLENASRLDVSDDIRRKYSWERVAETVVDSVDKAITRLG